MTHKKIRFRYGTSDIKYFLFVLSLMFLLYLFQACTAGKYLTLEESRTSKSISNEIHIDSLLKYGGVIFESESGEPYQYITLDNGMLKSKTQRNHITTTIAPLPTSGDIWDKIVMTSFAFLGCIFILAGLAVTLILSKK